MTQKLTTIGYRDYRLCPRHTVPIFIYDGQPNAKIVSSYEVGPDLVKIPKKRPKQAR